MGAGTVLDALAARNAIDAGASFVVSPGLDLETVALCKEAGVAAYGAHPPGDLVVFGWPCHAESPLPCPCGGAGARMACGMDDAASICLRRTS